MDSFPQELISHIFALAVYQPTTNDVSSLLAITHVCSRWRTITLADGNLWNRVVLTFPVSPRHLSYTAACLHRSGKYSLDIFLDFRDPSWDWNEDTHPFRWRNMESIMSLLREHIHRWKRFELLTDTWAPIFTFLWYTRSIQSAPMLETLYLARCNMYLAASGQTFHPVSLRQPIQLFGGIVLGRLRNVSLVGVHIDWNTTVPFLNLTELEFKYMASDVTPNLGQFHSILSGCPLLLRLAIFGWGPSLEPPAFGGSAVEVKILLQSLKIFSFGFLDIPYAIKLLSLFDFPSLEELMLEDISRIITPMNAQDSAPLLMWLTFASQARRAVFPLSQIRTLELQSVTCKTEPSIVFFLELTSLTKLSLIDVSDDLLRAFNNPPDTDSNLRNSRTSSVDARVSTGLCPSLEELRCQDVNLDILLMVVASRASTSTSNQHSTLKKVSLELVRTPSPPPDSIIRLTSAGIDLHHEGG